MTELFDPPIDKRTLPNLQTRNPMTYCLMVAALGLTSAAIAEEVINPSLNWGNVVSPKIAPPQQEPETFCQNVAKHDNPMAELIGRTVCGHQPKPPQF
jgi:hypothetical protein